MQIHFILKVAPWQSQFKLELILKVAPWQSQFKLELTHNEFGGRHLILNLAYKADTV